MQNRIDRIDVSRETWVQAKELYRTNELFSLYENELLWWNKRVNLVSRDVSRETVREHVIHSLFPSMLGLLNPCSEWVDAGTGGGLPGIPLAIAEPRKEWLLNDVVFKKITAVKQMMHRLELTNCRGEAVPVGKLQMDEGVGVISKHAFSIENLLHHLHGKPWRRVVMYKGEAEAREELHEAEGFFTAAIYTFAFEKEEPFYQGKCLLVLDR